MHPKHSSHFFCLMLLVSFKLEALPNCDPWVAKVASVQGQVDAQLIDSDAWQAVHPGDTLCPGDKIRTAKWARSTLQLHNESILTLDQNTTLILPGLKTDKLGWFMQLLQGTTFFRSRESQRLNIETPFINAVHQGTEFLIKVTSEQAEIAVFDGEISAQNAQGKIQIKKGFLGIAEKNRAPRIEILRITPEDAVQWALYYPPLIAVSPNKLSDSIALQSAFLSYQQGDAAGALTKLFEVPLAAQDARFLSFKAGLLLSVGRVDEANQAIQALEQSNADPSSALALKAVIAVSKNQQKSALDLANQAVSLNPNSSVAHIALSYAYQSLFKIEDALKATQKATELTPDNALAWARLAELQLSTGERDAALISAQKAQTLNPGLSRTQTIRGFADLAQTDIDAARQAFLQAIKLDSSDPLARLGLGLVKIRTGDLKEGAEELETAVNLDPNNAVIRSYLGKAYYELRNKDYAGKEFEIAKEMDNKDPTPWFYDAILKQTTNRPVEALQDMQKAVELNDNRGVYRSRLLLDKDEATRQAGLGRIFNGLGFDDPANRLAMKSLATDPSNYSAHRLLSDSYATKPRHEIARSSEYLQSQLLQPLSYNPVQPSLAYSDLNIIRGVGPAATTFNEYNRLFERNGIRFTTTGMYGSNNTLGDEAALSGILNKFAFSLGQLHYRTDGFRQNNELKHNLYNAFAQYEISSAVNVQAEYRHRETEQGDLQLQGNANIFDEKYSRKLDQNSYRLGMKMSPAQHSDILVSLIHANRTEIVDNSFMFKGVNYLSTQNLKTNSYDFETQYLFHNDHFNTITGIGIYRTDNHREDKNNRPGSICPCFTNYNTTQYFGYLYSNFKVFNNLNITAGLSFDKYKDNEEDNGANINELNPKFGLLWKVNNYISFRAAGFKSVKSAIVDNQILQPTQISGFNQFFDDPNGTVAWQYGIGIDSHLHKNIYAGVEAYKRELKTPVSTASYNQTREELYRLYFNWTPINYITINSEFRFENFRGIDKLPNFVETAYIPLEIRFFNEIGFFSALRGTYVNQKMNPDIVSDGDFKSNFYLVDASIGYRLPKQYGLISFEVKNLFDTHFNYRDRQFLMNEQRSSDFIPERMLIVRLTLNF